MYCTECGTDNAPDSRFCRNCGTPVPRAAASVAEPSAPTEPAIEPSSGVGAPPDEDEVLALLRRAIDAEGLGDVAGGIESAEEAVRLDPAHAVARSSLAGLYERAGRTAEAIEQYDAALQLDPQSRRDRIRLAALAPNHPTLGGVAAAEASGRRGIALAIGVAAAVFVLVTSAGLLTYFRWWVPKQSIAGAVRTASLPQDALLAQARQALDAGDLATAERDLLAYLASDPTDPEARSLLMETTRRQGAAGVTEAAATPQLDSLVFGQAENANSASDAVLGLEDGLAAGRVAGSPSPSTTPTTQLPPLGLPTLPLPGTSSAPAVGAMLPPVTNPIATGPAAENVLINRVSPGNRTPTAESPWGGGNPNGVLQGLPGASQGGGWAPSAGGGLTRGGPRQPQPGPTYPTVGASSGGSPAPAGGGGAPAPAGGGGTLRPGGNALTPAGGGAARSGPVIRPSGEAGASSRSGDRGNQLADQAQRLQGEAYGTRDRQETARKLEEAKRLWGQSGLPQARDQVDRIDDQLRALGAGQ